MKLLMEQWRNYIQESQTGFKTVGELKAALQQVATQKKVDVGKDSANAVLGTGLDIATAGVLPVLKYLWSQGQKNTKLAKSSKVLDALMIDPFVSRVVDDGLELAFIEYISKIIDGKKDEDRLDDINMTDQLSAYIKQDYADVIVKSPKK